ncbi:DUF1697 domain-containing protein [Pseudarthrobacter sp. NamE2]|uniref:DUF1697 domain-containing protein n=1 Tax=Pseudarthrobacter sp. NamE2 TaxID=2576838 RepID=UPI0010FD3790|nr:DUF1697 domain-containing protein [Pseudarthrobacter sp. NamE2]TLM81707.1 DUF1697 domain-containing protein [Pseudarthrobacter sp. NamE2]
MPTYIAFLRAINLGANRKFPKEDIRRAVESAGFRDVETYINTGNVRFTTGMRSLPKIEAALEAAFLADRGFEVPTIVYGTTELAGIAADAASLAVEHPEAARRYVDLLRFQPGADTARRMEAASTENIHLFVRGRALHTLVDHGTESAGPVLVTVSKMLGVSTNRNANVIAAVAGRWCR